MLFQYNQGSNTIGGRKLKCIKFAEDMKVLTESKRKFNEILDNLHRGCNNLGININIKKRKCILLSKF